MRFQDDDFDDLPLGTDIEVFSRTTLALFALMGCCGLMSCVGFWLWLYG